jgi:inner membrane protein
MDEDGVGRYGKGPLPRHGPGPTAEPMLGDGTATGKESARDGPEIDRGEVRDRAWNPGVAAAVDPVTHSLAGASLSAAGLRRATPLATATLVLGANAPDVDILAQFWGPWTALAWRRGLTHGIPALLLLPLLVTGVILAWDRWVRRAGWRRGRSLPSGDSRAPLPPARAAPVLGLAALGVWTHSPLDWVNNYGMRWFLPFDGRWSYGDAVFILDPWLWLLLGGSLFVLYSRTRWSSAAWGLLAGAMTLLVLLAPGIPGLSRALWLAGVAGWITIRLWGTPDRDSPGGRRVARISLALAALYILAMVGQGGLQERVVLAAAEREGLEVEEVMVAPVPANPFAGQVIAVTSGRYHPGELHWLRRPVVRFDESPLPRPSTADPRIRAAMEDRDVQDYLVWSRFPLFQMEEEGDVWRVRLLDARYIGRGDGALTGPTVTVPRR